MDTHSMTGSHAVPNEGGAGAGTHEPAPEHAASITSHSYVKMRHIVERPILTKECLMGNLQKVKSCVERYGQDVNGAGLDGVTPLHIAAERGNVELCTYLVGARADVFARSSDGLCPLHMAARGGYVHVLRMFQKSEGFYQGDMDIRTHDQWSALHFACRDARTEVFDFLVKETTRTAAIMDVDLDARTHDGRTPLLIAAERGNLHMVATLLEYGASSSAVCPHEREGFSGLGALHLACMWGHLAVAKHLVLQGEQLDVRSRGGWTPLMMAAHRGHKGIVEVLVNAGADVGMATRDHGHTALGLAERRGHSEVVRVLEQELAFLAKEAAGR